MNNEYLVLENMRLAYKVAWDMSNTGIEMDDLKSVALLGLVKAAEKFEEDRNVKFSTFAVCVIRNEILQEVRRQKRHRVEISLYTPVTEDGVTFEDVLCDSRDFYDRTEMLETLSATAGSLTEKERKTLGLMLSGASQTDIGAAIGCTQPQVSKCYRSAIGKIQKYIA